MIYYDSNDTIKQNMPGKKYWHGGEKAITKTQKENHIKEAVEYYNKGNYYYAGLKLGTVLHAVQDIPAHMYNSIIRNNDVYKDGKLTKEEARSNFWNFEQAYNDKGDIGKFLRKKVEEKANKKKICYVMKKIPKQAKSILGIQL